MRQKIRLCMGAIGLLLVFFAANLFLSELAIQRLDRILELDKKAYDLQQALTEEKESFARYMLSKDEEDLEHLRISFVRSRRRLNAVPMDPSRTDETVYMNIWTIWNVYGFYEGQRNRFMEMTRDDHEYLTVLYELYKIQDYLEIYSRMLTEAMLDYGNLTYAREVSLVRRQQAAAVTFCLLFILLLVRGASYLNRNYVQPVIALSEDAKRVSNHDFSGEGTVCHSHDEMEILTSEFARMKTFTEGYMEALRRQNQAESELHLRELRQAELERESERSRLQALKNQINPHFLFNTLNTIACHARISRERETYEMIEALSGLLRYNLRTQSVSVPLREEINVLRHYLYIQNMRFGDRIQCRIDCPEQLYAALVPAFILQPMVENAYQHGLAMRKAGGFIQVRVVGTEAQMMIVVADNGEGMDKRRLTAVRHTIAKQGRTSGTGIGIGNVARRVGLLFEGGSLRVYSRKGQGTRVIIRFTPGKQEAI